jgi:hypothetical protein
VQIFIEPSSQEKPWDKLFLAWIMHKQAERSVWMYYGLRGGTQAIPHEKNLLL